MLRKVFMFSLVLLVVVVICVPCARQAGAQMRTWTTLTAFEVEYKGKPIPEGVVARHGDKPVGRSFRIPGAGLLRVTHWEDPFYAYGASNKNPNTGGMGLSREGDGSWIGKDIHQGSEPKNGANGQPLKTCWVREFTKGRDGGVEVSAPFTYGYWQQLPLKHKVRVEFSPGVLREGETFDSSCNISGGTAPATKPPTSTGAGGGTPSPGTAAGIAGSYALDGNGYLGKLEISVNGGAVTVRMYYDVARKWETMTNVRYSGNTISFTRPWAGNPTFQQYTGTIRGSSISGSFTDNNTPGRQFPWQATR